MANVLLVDDDTTGLEIRKMILEHAGHRVVAVSDSEQALAEGGAQDCAVLDLRLPNPEDGLALIRDLHRSQPNLRMLVLCGYAADLDGRPERELVDEVFCKPVRPDQLLRAVEGCAAAKLKSS
jgi:CheY-like chemotaxis protein